MNIFLKMMMKMTQYKKKNFQKRQELIFLIKIKLKLNLRKY